MDEKYFNYWAYAEGSHYKFKDIFTTQRAVCEKHKNLEEWNINPLTIRLCLLQEVFKNLFEARLEIRQKTSNPGYVYHDTQATNVSGITSSLIVPKSGYMGEAFSSNLHEVYKNFYAFCSFFSAALDRLAYEIHILYGIGKPDKVDWRQFRNKKGENCILFNDLVPKNRDLANVISKEDFSQLLEIGDSLEHGKKIDISVTSPDANFDFTIKCENLENRIVELSYTQIMNLLNMCEEFYKSINS